MGVGAIGSALVTGYIYNPNRVTSKSLDKISKISDDVLDGKLDVQNNISYERNLRHEGNVETVLVSGRSKTDPDMLTGRNYANKIVNFKGDDALTGTLVKTKITKAQTWILYGELV